MVFRTSNALALVKAAAVKMGAAAPRLFILGVGRISLAFSTKTAASY